MHQHLVNVDWQVCNQHLQDLVVVLDVVDLGQLLEERPQLGGLQREVSSCRQHLTHLLQGPLVDLGLPELQKSLGQVEELPHSRAKELPVPFEH